MDNDIQDTLERARIKAGDVRTKAGETVKNAGASLKNGAERIGERARAASAGTGENLEKAKERARKTANEANRIVAEHPLAAAAAAVAVGALVAYAFPRGSRNIRAAAPKLLAAAGTVSQKARQSLTEQATARAATSAEEGEHLFEKISGAARKAPASAAEAARSGLENARTGLENARNFAAETAKRAEIEERAGKFLDAATDIAAKLVTKMRDHSRKDAGKD